MLYHIHLLFACTTLYLLLSHNAYAFNVTKLLKNQIQIVNGRWGNCGYSADPFMIRSFTLNPDPLKIPGPVTIGITLDFVKPSPTDITLLVVLEKNILGFWIKVPCTHNIGSCVYQDICKYWADACPFLKIYDIPCICPIATGNYTIPDTTVEATQSLPSDAPGSYRLFANLLSQSAGELGCLYVEFSLSG